MRKGVGVFGNRILIGKRREFTHFPFFHVWNEAIRRIRRNMLGVVFAGRRFGHGFYNMRFKILS